MTNNYAEEAVMRSKMYTLEKEKRGFMKPQYAIKHDGTTILYLADGELAETIVNLLRNVYKLGFVCGVHRRD
jgi:hypothetical protein